MAIYVCKKDVTYGRISYVVGQEMEIPDDLVPTAKIDSVISRDFELKGEEPVQPENKDVAPGSLPMSKVKSPPTDMLPDAESKPEGQEEPEVNKQGTESKNIFKRGPGRPIGGKKR